jgi:hypothetical protein
MQDDGTFRNDYYARVAGVSTEEMNRLECAFLTRLQFQVNVDVFEYKRMEEPLLTMARTMKEQELKSACMNAS